MRVLPIFKWKRVDSLPVTMQRDFLRSMKLAFEKMERGRVFEGKAVRVSEVAEEYNCVRSLLAYCCGACCTAVGYCTASRGKRSSQPPPAELSCD